MKRKTALYKFVNALQTIRAAVHILLYNLSPSKAVIDKDIERWVRETGGLDGLVFPNQQWLVWLLWRYPEFRNLFYFRIKKDRGVLNQILLGFSRLFFPPIDTLVLDSPAIGEGLFIQHGFSTIISAESIGKNCWVNQQVTIGFSNEYDRPTLGDNVHITAGAKVIGKILIGNNSIIGANAVVVKNVPSDCTVVGVPGYVIRRNNQKVKEPL